MQDKDRSSESLLGRNEQREARQKQLELAIKEALQREAAHREILIKNMHRLRALRLERDQKAKTKFSERKEKQTTDILVLAATSMASRTFPRLRGMASGT